MKFCVVGSGSSGNMTVIETCKNKIIVDCGLSYLDSTKRLIDKDINLDNITKIFITHEHIDHVHFLVQLMKKTNSILYISKSSFLGLNDNIKREINEKRIRFIEAESKYDFEDFSLLTFKLSHDTYECLGFEFIENSKKLIYMTDTGIVPIKYEPFLKTCDALIIESNHDVVMLQNSARPYFLKNRILSNKGHLSNQTTFELLERVLFSQKHVILAHISKECNCDDAIRRDVIDKLDFFNGTIEIAREKIATKVYQL